ncbi:MAG: AAA family ATPase [Chloroherpetonaceae bacterium]
MIVSRLILKNWRNFRSVAVPLSERVFIVGANASGKSNLLDVFRFLRDIAKQQGGGLQKAIEQRDGLSKIRCLAARKYPDVEIEVHLSNNDSHKPKWKYAIGIRQETRGHREPYLAFEKVWKGEQLILNRPNKDDNNDKERLKQTHLEQINSNSDFREIARFFESINYIHLVPQLLKFPNAFAGNALEGDPFGRDFLQRIARTPEKTRNARLKKIEEGLELAVPQLKSLQFERDELGLPHLKATYEHWRASGAKQREDQFSDGTLRLIGLLWAMLESDSLLLLEEPELSLNTGIVKQLAGLIHRIQRQKKRQVLISTHSAELLGEGVGGEETLLLETKREGTEIRQAASIKEVRAMLESGFSVGEAVMPIVTPPKVAEISLGF